MEPGQVIGGKYRLTRKVGKGGMGTVWAATEISRGTPVAIKLLTTEAAASDELRQRLVREANVATLVRHPNIVHFHEVGLTDDGEPFLVMELLHGQTLRQLMRDRGKLDHPTALWIGCEIAKALHAAHEAAIAHRDLKPGNVFLSRDADGRVTIKVVDFGVSKFLGEDQSTLTSTGATIGSPAYMSPEQARGERIDHRTDIWALGVVLFEMIAGERPFAAESPVALLSKILFGSVPRLRSVVPDVDPVVDAIVSRCLEHRMDARYQTIDQVLAALSSRQAAMAEAAQAKQAELAEWVDQPHAPESPDTASARDEEAPSTASGNSQSASESASLPSTGSQSHSTTHGVAASVPSPPPAVGPRAVQRAGAPGIPLAAVLVPGFAVAALAIAVIILVVRASIRSGDEEQDVIPAGAGSVTEPASLPPKVDPPPQPVEVPVVPLPEKDADSATAEPAKPKPTASTPATKPTAPAPATKPTAPAPATKPVVKPVVKPPTQPTAAPSKPCKRPIVDASGKVIGCLD